MPFGVPILHRIVGARQKERPMAKLRPMPEAWPHRCTACKKQKPASDFQHCRGKLETPLHTRCKSCETCKECKRCFIDHRSMAPDRSGGTISKASGGGTIRTPRDGRTMPKRSGLSLDSVITTLILTTTVTTMVRSTGSRCNYSNNRPECNDVTLTDESPQ